MPRKTEVEIRDVVPPPEVQEVIFGAPVVHEREGYTARHVEVHLTGSQAIAIKALMVGLMRNAATLSTGRVVKSQADAVRWLADQVYDQLGSDKSERSEN